MEIDLCGGTIGCPQCGVALADLELHLRWHTNLTASLTHLSEMTVSTSAALEDLADYLLERGEWGPSRR
jgi:hypothetical protein